jgi:hypothetical protein
MLHLTRSVKHDVPPSEVCLYYLGLLEPYSVKQSMVRFSTATMFWRTDVQFGEFVLRVKGEDREAALDVLATMLESAAASIRARALDQK